MITIASAPLYQYGTVIPASAPNRDSWMPVGSWLSSNASADRNSSTSAPRISRASATMSSQAASSGGPPTPSSGSQSSASSSTSSQDLPSSLRRNMRS